MKLQYINDSLNDIWEIFYLQLIRNSDQNNVNLLDFKRIENNIFKSSMLSWSLSVNNFGQKPDPFWWMSNFLLLGNDHLHVTLTVKGMRPKKMLFFSFLQVLFIIFYQVFFEMNVFFIVWQNKCLFVPGKILHLCFAKSSSFCLRSSKSYLNIFIKSKMNKFNFYHRKICEPL